MLIIKQGDTRNAIEGIITRKGKPVDITDCKVFITILGEVCEDECMYGDVTKGEVLYGLSFLSLEKTGTFLYEFIVEYPDGLREPFPNNSYLELKINDKLEEC